jgi:O-antigen/teichoic acid export membrane protein
VSEQRAAMHAAAVDPTPAVTGDMIGEEPPPPMAKTAAKGMSVFMGFALLAKGATVGAQVVLGLVLTQADFGLYSTALAISTIGLALRDGGSSDWIIQKGPKQIRDWLGPAFWMATAFNTGVALLLFAIAAAIWLAGSSKELAVMVGACALSQVLQSPAGTLTALLRSQLRFGEVGRVLGISALLRQLFAPLFAVGGFGAPSFTLPMILCSAYESLRSWYQTREMPWKLSPRFETWRTILKDTRWIMLNNGASAMTNVGDYAVLSVILLADQRGVYLFAYQLVVQSAVFLTANLTQVMFPTLAALKDDPKRFGAALLRTNRALMLVLAPATVGTAAVIAPLEDLVFKGRWDAAVPVVILCSILFPARAIVPLSLSSMMALGRFRDNSIVTIVIGVSMMAGAAIGAIAANAFDATWTRAFLEAIGIEGGFRGVLTRETALTMFASGALGATLGCGVLRAVSSTWGILRAAKLAQVRRRDTLDAILGSWVLSTFALVPTFAIDWFVIADAHPLVRCIVAMVVYSLVWFVLTRLLLERDLRDLLNVMPAKVRPLGRKLMLMKDRG